jgi:hypothetical protein
MESTVDKEILLVNVGDTINLTCKINAREIDWHFKDRNHTTTILAYGRQLQVTQPVLFDVSRYEASDQELEDFDDTKRDRVRAARSEATGRRLQPKYRVTSDRAQHHVLTVYVQGAQDEGSYQCIDSKSETPIKKNIYVYLSKQ